MVSDGRGGGGAYGIFEVRPRGLVQAVTPARVRRLYGRVLPGRV